MVKMICILRNYICILWGIVMSFLNKLFKKTGSFQKLYN